MHWPWALNDRDVTPKFSICIPNYNYRDYLKLTCASVTDQVYNNYEIVISDNQSTDGSIDFIREFANGTPGTRVNINPVNLGFAANLERASALATGDYYILLSSDDLMNAACLETYSKIIQQHSGEKFVLGSSVYKIDSNSVIIDRSSPDPEYWRNEDVDNNLSERFGAKVYKVPANEMLRRCLKVMGNPYHFLTVCYSKELFQQIGGYSGGRMYNPDKWFNWKLFTKADFVLLVDEPLFSYRWHAQNQVALETSFGHLKYLVDEYRNTIELTSEMLEKAGLNSDQAKLNFVKRNIYRHGLGEFVKGRWLKSMRIFSFGLATFPGVVMKRSLFVPYVVLLATTPIGSLASKFIYRLFKSK